MLLCVFNGGKKEKYRVYFKRFVNMYTIKSSTSSHTDRPDTQRNRYTYTHMTRHDTQCVRSYDFELFRCVCACTSFYPCQKHTYTGA